MGTLYGILDIVISDNGSQFISEEFKAFTTASGIEHITSLPLHQQANGLAEKALQIVKHITKCHNTGENMYISLLELSNTPRDNVVETSIQRLMGRCTKTLLPNTDNLNRLKAADSERVKSKLVVVYHETQKHYYDKGGKVHDEIQPGDAVHIHTPDGWKPTECVGTATYL